MRTIAGFIAGIVRESEVEQPAEALSLLEQAVRWQQADGKGRRQGSSWDLFLHDYAVEQLGRFAWSVITKYAARAEPIFRPGHRSFEVNAATVTTEATEKATDELRGLEGVPRYLRARLLPDDLDLEVTFLKDDLEQGISQVVLKRQEELKKEFDSNCSIVHRVLAKEAEVEINCLAEWNAEVEAAWHGRFCDLVHYNELNENMRRFFKETYDDWLEFLTDTLEYQVSKTHIDWQSALALLLTILVFAVIAIAAPCSEKRGRCESGADEFKGPGKRGPRDPTAAIIAV
jgi:hypothetical protein